LFLRMIRHASRSPLFPYTTLFRSLFWYRLPGLLAIVALIIYTLFMLSLFKIIPVTLTASGIAGFILSLGMAIDANILIFERMKRSEEHTSELQSRENLVCRLLLEK